MKKEWDKALRLLRVLSDEVDTSSGKLRVEEWVGKIEDTVKKPRYHASLVYGIAPSYECIMGEEKDSPIDAVVLLRDKVTEKGLI